MNLKAGGIAAAFGFVLSLIIGLIFGNGVFAVPRAFLFAAFFFALVNAIIFVTRRFLPELLEQSPEAGGGGPRPGSLIDIVEGSETVDMLGMEADIESPDSRQVPGGKDSGLAFGPDLSGERFSDGNGPGGDTSGPPLDLTGKDSYNGERVFPGAELPPQSAPPFAAGNAAPPGGGAFAGTLPDFGTMSQASLTPDGKAGEAGNRTARGGDDVFHFSVTGQSPEPSPEYYKGSKPVELEGDFPPKRIAQAIQTVLKHDE